jgi:hypothetical protein
MPQAIKSRSCVELPTMNGGDHSALTPKKEAAMPRDKEGHGIILDDKGQEQPTDKDRAQTAQKTEPGHMPSQPKKQEKPDPKS